MDIPYLALSKQRPNLFLPLDRCEVALDIRNARTGRSTIRDAVKGGSPEASGLEGPRKVCAAATEFQA